MFVFLSVFFYSAVDSWSGWKSGFISVSIILFIVAHYIHISCCNKRLLIGCNVLDFIISAGFGFLFPEVSGTIYLIYFGVIATTVFLYFTEKSIIWIFSVAVIVVWALASIQRYQVHNVFSLYDDLLGFMFIFYCAIVGGLIRNLISARETIADQYIQLNSSHEALQLAHEQLGTYSDQVEELTVIRERNEIAREIHDTVGHKMTAMLVQLQLAGELSGKDDNQTKEIIRTCEQLGRDALNEIRMSVRTLKDELPVNVPLHHTLKSMLEDFSALTGLEVIFDTGKDQNHVPVTLHQAIKRIIQEALTNTKRHSDATKCQILLSSDYEKVELHIKDNGTGTKSFIPGFGLNNMKERVHEQGGSIYFKGMQESEFLIHIEFQLEKNTSIKEVRI